MPTWYPDSSVPDGSDSKALPSPLSWSLHGLKVGALVGAASGLTSASASLLSSAPRPPATKILAATAVSAALLSLSFFVLSLLVSPALRHRAGRGLALALQAIAAGLFVGVHLTSGVLKAFSGSYLTLGAVEFFMAGGPHLLLTIVVGYGRWVALLGLVVTAVIVMVTRAGRAALRRSPRTGAARQPRQLLGFAALTGFASAGLVPAAVSKDLAAASPEAAFAESLTPGEWEPVTAEPEANGRAIGGTPRRVPDEGPVQTEGKRWRELARAAPTRKTNVLLLTLESISIKHLGYFGYDRGTTPNLDRIAERSLRIRRAWTTATHSNYAQMAILSSLFPRRTTGLDVYRRLDYPRVLLHDAFNLLGYSTATVSSQDETWQGMLKFQETGTPTFYRHSRNYDGLRQDIGSELVVLDHVTVEVASDWIRRQGPKPWSLYVNFQATHFPYKLQPGIPAPYQPTNLTPGTFDYLGYPESDRQQVINRYDNALHYVDEQIGRLEKALERAGQLDDTIWIITADHGENFHDHRQVTHGKTLYDTEARIPLLIHWPKGLEPADVNDPVSHLDILPTLLDLLRLPPHPAFQGRSFLSGAEPSQQPPGIYMNIQGLKSGEAVVCWPWKLVVNRSMKTTELFQLERDPDELDDRIEREAEVADALKRTLSAQISAQLAYHKQGNPALTERYAPRLLSCPSLPGVQRAAVPEQEKPERARGTAPTELVREVEAKAPERKN